MVNYSRFFRNLFIASIVASLLSFAGLTSYIITDLYPPIDNVKLKNGDVLGGDFLAFYTGGYLFKHSRSDLYNYSEKKDFHKETLTNAILLGALPFIYPPLVAAILSLLTHLSFEHAFYIIAITYTLIPFYTSTFCFA